MTLIANAAARVPEKTLPRAPNNSLSDHGAHDGGGACPQPWRALRPFGESYPCLHIHPGTMSMAKIQQSNKEAKKEPLLSLKEKRAAKKAKDGPKAMVPFLPPKKP